MAETKKKDRHRPGYYKEYAKRTGRKDRHRKGYYREYNLKHPERIAHFLELCDSHGKPWKVAHPEWYDDYGRLIKDFGDEEGIDPCSCEGLGQWCD